MAVDGLGARGSWFGFAPPTHDMPEGPQADRSNWLLLPPDLGDVPYEARTDVPRDPIVLKIASPDDPDPVIASLIANVHWVFARVFGMRLTVVDAADASRVIVIEELRLSRYRPLSHAPHIEGIRVEAIGTWASRQRFEEVGESEESAEHRVLEEDAEQRTNVARSALHSLFTSLEKVVDHPPYLNPHDWLRRA